MPQTHITLRALEPEDIDLLYKWENDRSLWHLSNTHKPFSRYTLEQYILNAHLDFYENKQMRLMIDVESENDITSIGCVDIFDFEPQHKRAGIGIIIDAQYRQKGHASRVIKLLFDYAKNHLNLNQLHCHILTDNDISINLFEKMGFEKTGCKKKWIFKNKKWHDVGFYQKFL